MIPLGEPDPHHRLECALARCESQITGLQQDNAALQERLGSLESGAIEQERTIRHTLTMLIEWIERDEAHSVAA